MYPLDSFLIKKSFFVDNKEYFYFSLEEFFKKFDIDSNIFPYSLKILLENNLRNEDGKRINASQIKNFAQSINLNKDILEILFYPTRVLMQDFTGVPAIADLAAMRTALDKKNIDPKNINPKIPVDLVIDHSVMVDQYGNNNAYSNNVKKEFERNKERYEFLKWGQNTFSNFNVVPPGTGICHQVNLEHLSKTFWIEKKDNKNYIFPDSLVGTDSHTTMVNALSVLGWGVGGIEAEATILGEPITMNIPQVVGVKLNGKLNDGITATDLVLTITETLRKKGVVGKFVEFIGSGLNNITLADRATISNMSPEYGATCGFFPVDQETLNYLNLTGKSEHHIKVVKEYANLQGLWRDDKIIANYEDVIEINLNQIEQSLAGPKRPQDRIYLSNVPNSFKKFAQEKKQDINSDNNGLQNGSVVIAAITSCTNTSNPNVLVAAGLLAKKAREKGLQSKPWVKTSLAPGSKVVSQYLDDSGLSISLNELGFNTVGYGCTTCIGNSGPLDKEISEEIKTKNLIVSSVLSGNRNFEGRIHSEVKANYLASPPLVVAYALAGNVNIDFNKFPIGEDKNNNNIYLKDLWPSNKEINEIVKSKVRKDIFIKKYKDVNKGDENWEKINTDTKPLFNWNLSSTYVKQPPFFSNDSSQNNEDLINSRVLVMLGDSITTDHISPAGSIKDNSPAGKYLSNMQIPYSGYNSYGARRGNHEVMIRGTFANVRLKNELAEGAEGGITKNFLNGESTSIYEASNQYKKEKVPLIIIAGKEYGTGSSRDWAAKGTKLLGVKAVIAESFERIHRSNLIGMGVIPFEFTSEENRINLGLTGKEYFTILSISKLEPKKIIECKISKGKVDKKIKLLCRIDTNQELEYFKSGGILQYVLNKIVNK
tara:strand:+ start:481 stop:3123 length:2643 start_codon:yes stop_codon:yes gene_type:complete